LRASRATFLPLLEAETRRLRGAAVPRFALIFCCGFGGLRLDVRRRLTINPLLADGLSLARQMWGVQHSKWAPAGPSWVRIDKTYDEHNEFAFGRVATKKPCAKAISARRSIV
jgi:hypothetical protein